MILDKFRLDGKVAIVTGANTGLGQSMCVALTEAGANVVGVARRNCDETESLIEDAKNKFKFVQADLSTTKNINRKLKKL